MWLSKSNLICISVYSILSVEWLRSKVIQARIFSFFSIEGFKIKINQQKCRFYSNFVASITRSKWEVMHWRLLLIPIGRYVVIDVVKKHLCQFLFHCISLYFSRKKLDLNHFTSEPFSCKIAFNPFRPIDNSLLEKV